MLSGLGAAGQRARVADEALAAVVKAINAAFDHELATFTHGKLITPPLLHKKSLKLEGRGEWR